MAKLQYGIVGHPVKHSLSPAMHNAAFKALGLDADYALFDVAPEGLIDFLKAMPGRELSGVNITIPHKIAAKDYIEKNGTLDENARRLGAVNTVKVTSGHLHGHNTDVPGFYRSLVEELKFEPEGKNVFILGAGGAARAIAMYLGNGPRSIYVTDIDSIKVDELKSHYKKFYDEKKLYIVSGKDVNAAIGECQLLVNATPIGMKESDPLPVDAEALRPGLYVYDIVYNVPRTKLVMEATKKRLHAITGLGMLLYQGAVAFEIWTLKKAPIDVMRKALKEALACQHG
jgi:shikimate dehydrogenase